MGNKLRSQSDATGHHQKNIPLKLISLTKKNPIRKSKTGTYMQFHTN